MSRLFLLLMIELFLFKPLVYSQAFQLKVKIEGTKDSVLYLAHYYADKQYIDDTLTKARPEYYVFSADSVLPAGLYIIAGEKKNRIFEFLIHEDKELVFETHIDDPVGKMKIKGSKENVLFFDYVRFLNSQQVVTQNLQKALKRVETTFPDSASIYRKQNEEVNRKVQEYMKEMAAGNPGTFLSAFILASRDPDIPEAPMLPNGRQDSTFAYRYYKSHFFENMPLDDTRLLRTPFYYQRLNYYFTKMVLQHPDTLIAEANRLIPVAKRKGDSYRFMVWYLTNHTERSEIMGMDAAFVDMVDKYYATGEMDYWVNATVKENLVKKAKKLRPILLGKPAPELLMLDTLMRPVSLRQTPAGYTILLFWDPSCSHCKKEIPKLKDLLARKGKEYNLAVFAVCSDTNMAEMKKYIRKYDMDWINVNGPRAYTPNYHELYDIFSTPVIYLLDEKKNIIAKRLMTDQLETFIQRHARNEGQGVLQMKDE